MWLLSAIPGNMHFIGIHSGDPCNNTKRYAWSILIFVVTVSYKVAVNTESVNTAPTALTRNMRLGSCQPLVTFSSAS